ncbi:MAG: hypothetical protein OEU54_02755 [Gemmatimonadota bacterium]|nr:hypothetical protein [Gemmatimonadota bacterium]
MPETSASKVPRLDAARWWRGSIIFLTLGVCFFIVARAATDPDLLGHIRFGQEILEEGEIPRVDQYSFTSGGQDWINHEWMAEVSFALIYNAFGNFGLHMLRLLVAMTIIVALYRHSMKSGLEPLRAGILLVLISLLLVNGTVTVRPQLFTFVFLLLLLLILSAVERGHRRLVWVIPLIMMAWINFHGGVLAGLVLVAAWMAGHWLAWLLPDDNVARRDSIGLPLTATAVLALCPIAMLINPYGWELLDFLFETATVSRPDITEWMPTPMRSRRGRIYLLLTVGSLLALHWTKSKRHPPLLLVFATIAVLPLLAVRHIPLFGIGVGVLLPVHFASVAYGRAGAEGSVSSGSGVLRPAMIAVTILTGFMLITAALPDLRCVKIDGIRSITFPVRAVEWIRRSEVEGKLATFFDWGEYAIWHLEPSVRVSMDGRRETVYTDSIYDEYLRFRNGLTGWEDHIDKRGAEMALVSVETPMFSLMQLKPGWDLMYQDSLSAIFAPTGSPHAARLAGTPIPTDYPQHGIGYCMP